MYNPKSHILKTIYTSHYRYSGPNRIDITVKGQHPDWKYFAPTWDMVKGVKNGTLSEEEYIRIYLDIIVGVHTSIWDKLLQYEEIVLVCFCPENAFCHRNILTRYITSTLNGRVKWLGWLKP